MKIFKNILLAFVCALGHWCAANTQAANGVIDLRSHDFSKERTCELIGQWEIYPERFYTAEDFQNDPTLPQKEATYARSTVDWASIPELNEGYKEFGYATYRLRILLPADFPKLALMIRDVNTAYKIFVNGEGFEGSGEISKTAENARANWRHATRTADFKPGENEIILQVSNFYHAKGGLSKPITIGDSDSIFYIRNLEIGGILFLTGCLLLAGIFALGLFWFKTSDVTGLFFFLFCGAFALFIVNSGPHLFQALFKDLAWGFSLRLLWISLYASIIFYGYFLLKTFSEEFKPQLFHAVAILSTVMIGLSLFAPIAFLSEIQVYYYVVVFAAVLVIALGGIQQAAFSHKLTWINTLGTISLFAIVVHLVASYLNITGYWPIFYVSGVTLFIFSQALVMAIKFGRNYRESSLAALAAAKTRDEFLNAMSHELKTPMNAILGMATFLEKSELKTKQRDKLKAIKKNAESLMSMINDVLSISELGSGHLRLSKSVIELQNSVESAISLSKQHLNRETVKFKYYLDPKIPALLKGDGPRIKQILMHLLNNAFRYTEKGEVELRVEMVEMSEGLVRLHFKITDTGVGMGRGGRSILSLITQNQKVLADKFSEPGLGLSVTNELLEMMGGHLEIKSKKNVGTQVTFELVLDEYVPESREVTALYSEHEIDTTLKIMYAEDNPVNRKLIEMMLKDLDLKVDMAVNGKEAYQMAMKKYYNIILMDIQMPEMDGMQASKKIVEHSNSRPIIIATTANLAEVDKRKCFEAGMNDFLSKPINQEELKLAILKWQGLKKYLDESTGDSIKLSS